MEEICREPGERMDSPEIRCGDSGYEYRSYLSAFGVTVFIEDGIYRGDWVTSTHVVIADEMVFEQYA